MLRRSAKKKGTRHGERRAFSSSLKTSELSLSCLNEFFTSLLRFGLIVYLLLLLLCLHLHLHFHPSMEFPAEYLPLFNQGDHIQLERWDNSRQYEEIEKYINESGLHQRFFEYHKWMTTPVFGFWNWDERQKSSESTDDDDLRTIRWMLLNSKSSHQ